MMVDTEYVLERMRAANPAPSLEQLAGDDLDLVRDIVARRRSGMTAPVKEPPHIRPDQLTPRRGLRPVLVAGLAFILVLGTLGASLLLFRGVDGEPAAPVATTAPVEEPTATIGSTCPPGSTPDQPGPPDQPHPFAGWTGIATFDPGSGRMLLLTHGALWMFDVCTNTWTEAPEPGEDFGYPRDFVYDVDSDRAIALASNEGTGVARVWVYNPDEQTWTRKGDWAVGSPRQWPLHDIPQLQAVYDPVTGLAVVREIHSSQMWTYDVDTDTWTVMNQGAALPPPAIDFQFLTYDASVDRLILYLAPDDRASSDLGTWEFDTRAGRWEKQQTNTPQVSFGWSPRGEEFVYDEASQVSVILSDVSDDDRFNDPVIAAYDASKHSWTVLQYESEVGEPAPYGYDPINQRILVTEVGGTVFAFNVATGEWITLLDPL